MGKEDWPIGDGKTRKARASVSCCSIYARLAKHDAYPREHSLFFDSGIHCDHVLVGLSLERIFRPQEPDGLSVLESHLLLASSTL
jgi:hypothetical protein